jgi:hypothetical protein
VKAYATVTTMKDGKPGKYEPRRAHVLRPGKNAVGRERARRDYEGCR